MEEPRGVLLKQDNPSFGRNQFYMDRFIIVISIISDIMNPYSLLISNVF